eukprot:4037280-Pyramimonas_sp.AAC.1
MGGWIMTPEDLWQTCWVKFARGTIILKAPGVLANTGVKGRTFDFGVVSEELSELASLELDGRGP